MSSSSLTLEAISNPVVVNDQHEQTSATLTLPLIINDANVQPGLIIVYPTEYYQEEAECQGNMEQLFKRRRRGSSIATTDVCYSTKSNRYYEIGSLIQKTLYGSIHHSVALQPAANARVNALLPSFTRLPKEQFAIKVYKKQDFTNAPSSSMKTQENPYQEMAILQYLADKEHLIPGVGKLVEVLEDETHLYNVLQFEEGEEVFELLAKQGAFSEEVTKEIMFQLLQSMAALHADNVVHRDISIENLIYNEATGRVVIVDFGLSRKVEHEAVIRNTQVGKVDYMAPEVIQGCHWYDPKQADLWSLGIVMLFLLLGFPPLEQATMADVRYEYIVTGRLREMLMGWGLTEEIVSNDCLEIVHALLQERAEDRVNAEELMQHSYFASCRLEANAKQCHATIVDCTSPLSPSTVVDFDQLSMTCSHHKRSFSALSSSTSSSSSTEANTQAYDFYYI